MIKGKTIAEVVKDNLCTGCGTCIALCPLSAVELITDDSKGIYVPRIKEGKCNECGICYGVCPGHSVDFKELNLSIFGQEPADIRLGNYLNTYIGHATDNEIRYNSASGGLITAVLIFALEEGIIDGALVTRMRRDNPLEPEPFIATTRTQIISAAKSKYCPVPANIALREILERRGKYAVVGLPCHFHGIRKWEMVNKKLKEKISLHLGILCANTISFLGTQLLLQKMNVRTEDIKRMDYRGEGWPGGMSVELNNGSRLFSPLRQYYDRTFGSFIPTRCMLCSDKACDLADISFGDAWSRSDQDKTGLSAIISRNEAGEMLLQQAALEGKIEVNKTDSAELIQGSGRDKKYYAGARISLFKMTGRRVPVYNQRIIRPTWDAYLSAMAIYLRIYMASNKHLRGLLGVYASALEYADLCISRVNRLFQIRH